MAFDKQNTDFDVVIIGAGISGINLGYLLQKHNPQLSYAILEGRHEIGGTWSLFKYPGIRSDSDLYTFGFAWRPWEAHTAIAEGHLIREYVQESAEMYGIDKKIQFKTFVDKAEWKSKNRHWELNVTVNGQEKKTIRSTWVQFATGYYDYNNPLQAAIPGIDDFKGKVIHPQFWPEDLDYKNKNVVIIGSGATSVTLLPAMADDAKHVTMLQRSPSYLLPLRREDPLEKLIRILFFWNRAIEHKLIRWKWLMTTFLFVQFCKNFPGPARTVVTAAIRLFLPRDGSVPQDPHFNPSYSPFEQRLCFCPDADFFKSLQTGKSDIVTDHIERVTANSIKLKSGKELHPDIIITATGLKLMLAGSAKIYVDGQEIHLGEKFVWKGLMMEDTPNAAFSIGYVDASWTLGAEATAQMVCRILNNMEKEGVNEVVPKLSDEEKEGTPEMPLIRLTSTYVTKAKKVIPRTLSSGPYQARSYYYKDIMMAHYGNLKAGLVWKKADGSS